MGLGASAGEIFFLAGASLAYPYFMAMDRIYLVGFMGAGKSTVGRELALKLHWTFIDLDAEIEKAEKLPIREIFNQFGESHFRRLESGYLRRVADTPRAIIALGGGTYVDPENRTLVDATGAVVWLQASLSTVAERVRPDGTRPLLSNPADAKKLYEARLASYRLARIHVLTDNRLPEAIADEIAGQVSKL